MHYIVGTRGSKLALAQTGQVVKRLKEAYSEDSFEIKVIKTTGDKITDRPLDKIGTKGIFVDAIEEQLMNGEIHLAVHSMKDMPNTPMEGLMFSKGWKREDPRDVLLLRSVKSLEELPIGATIATGSKRRAYLMKQMRPDVKIAPIRGNIDTRIRKMKEGFSDGIAIDGIIIAAAGLKRIGREDEITQYFDPKEFIPAPAQGSLALELKADNKELLDKLDALSNENADEIMTLERGFLKAIGGNCKEPIGAFAAKVGEEYVLRALYGDSEGKNVATVCVSSKLGGTELVEEAVEKIVEARGMIMDEKSCD